LTPTSSHDTEAAPARASAHRNGPAAPAGSAATDVARVRAFAERCAGLKTLQAAALLMPDADGGLRLRACWPVGAPVTPSLVRASARAWRGTQPVVRPVDEAVPKGARVLATRVSDAGGVYGLVAVLHGGPPEAVDPELAGWLDEPCLGVPLRPAAAAGASVQDGRGRPRTCAASPSPDSQARSGPVVSGPAAAAPVAAAPVAAAQLAAAQLAAARPAAGSASATGRVEATPSVASGGRSGASADVLPRIVACQAALFDAADLDAGLRALASTLARLYGCDRVAIGWANRRGARLAALSDSAADRAPGEAAEVLEAAMNEALDQQSGIAWPAELGREVRVNVAQALLARHAGVAAACSLPLAARGRPVGAVTLERAVEPFTEATLAELRGLLAFVAPVLEVERRSARPLRTLAARAGARLFGPRRRAGLAIVASALVLLVAAVLPIADPVTAPARVEGAEQRSLTAPVDGYLLRVHVRPGDMVKADQVLVALDDRDLELERLRWRTEAEQGDRQATEAIAREDRSQFAAHAARAAQARAQLALADAQLARQQVRAPFDGIVLSGDLTQSLGAPVRAGDALLTVAPAGRHRVIVDVDERDIARVSPGGAGVLALSAQAGTRLALVVTRISPAAVARDGRMVFEVEAQPPADAVLRPGFEGIARFEAGQRSAVMVLLERPWNALRQRLWAMGW
jgi:RND family efflux transporter MFP subunit